MMGKARVTVAIPVKNEADRVAGMLRALAAQTGLDGEAAPDFDLLLFVNNCVDASAAVAATEARTLGLRCEIIEATLEGADASAGGARRLAMQAAADRMTTSAEDSVILTTDADSCVPPDWIARNLAAISNGADAVAGFIVMEEADYVLLPERLRRRVAREALYERLVCEIDSRLAPSPHDPWPRHSHNSGASLAVTLAAFRRIGGVPRVSVGEDRAFVAALSRRGYRVRHALEIRVTTSGRLIGRAEGGYADTIRQRITAPRSRCDPYLQPLWRVVRGHVADETRSGIDPASLTFHIALAAFCVRLFRLTDTLTVVTGTTRRDGSNRRKPPQAEPVAIP